MSDRDAPEPALPLDDDLVTRRVTISFALGGALLLVVGLAVSSTPLAVIGATFLIFAWPLNLLYRAQAGHHYATAWWPQDGPRPGERTAIVGSATTVLVRTSGWDVVRSRNDQDTILIVERRGPLAWIARQLQDRPTLADAGLLGKAPVA